VFKIPVSLSPSSSQLPVNLSMLLEPVNFQHILFPMPLQKEGDEPRIDVGLSSMIYL